MQKIWKWATGAVAVTSLGVFAISLTSRIVHYQVLFDNISKDLKSTNQFDLLNNTIHEAKTNTNYIPILDNIARDFSFSRHLQMYKYTPRIGVRIYAPTWQPFRYNMAGTVGNVYINIIMQTNIWEPLKREVVYQMSQSTTTTVTV
jgi:hypothetical protein